jgi:hypothetical protein
MGLPKISLSITPLHKKMLPNIMDIPFLSDFISKSINLAAHEYVAPKSMILDLQTLLSSDGVKRGTASNTYRETEARFHHRFNQRWGHHSTYSQMHELKEYGSTDWSR